MKLPFALILSAVALCGCTHVTSVSESLKAEPAKLSTFLVHRSEMKPQRERAPFALVWVNPALRQGRAKYDSIYVAPVVTAYLRPAKSTVTQKGGMPKTARPVREMAGLLRHSFESAFRQSPRPMLHLTRSPHLGGVTLELALVELNPTDAAGNVAKSAIPGGAGALLGGFTSGNIAIEGRVHDNLTGNILFEFADNEADKMSVASVRDYGAFSHAQVSIQEWARQFEELTRTPASHKVEDSSAFTLNPF